MRLVCLVLNMMLTWMVLGLIPEIAVIMFLLLNNKKSRGCLLITHSRGLVVGYSRTRVG